MVRIYEEYSGQLSTAHDIYNYIHGGRGVVKLEAPSGKSHNYVFTKPNDPTFPDDVLFVYALHDKTQKFYVGMIEKDKFRLTKHSELYPHQIYGCG